VDRDTPSPEPDGRPTYNGVQPGSPGGLLTTLLSLPQCHAALSTIPSTLAWVDRTPLSSVCHSTPQQGIPSTLVTASHMIQGRVEYESTIAQGTEEGLDLWDVKYWLQDLKERDHSGYCTLIKSGLYRRSI